MTDPHQDVLDDQPDVYQPAEDSELLAATAADYLVGGEVVLDVGTGSGYVAERVADATGARVVGADRNPHACRQARDRGVEAVRADLVGPFRDGAFDAVLFNPPYLPTDPDREWSDWMELALSGGETGRRVIEPFVRAVPRVLAPEGRVFLLVSTLTGVDAVRNLARTAGLTTEIVAEESHPFEKLVVLRLVKITPKHNPD
ncbi:MAG: HemK2/MTQ2 family protein methyltransferase [Haloarculaceae archaeon]